MVYLEAVEPPPELAVRPSGVLYERCGLFADPRGELLRLIERDAGRLRVRAVDGGESFI